jgi:hypothetical protein
MFHHFKAAFKLQTSIFMLNLIFRRCETYCSQQKFLINYDFLPDELRRLARDKQRIKSATNCN